MRIERTMQDVSAGGLETGSRKGTRLQMKNSGWQARFAHGIGRWVVGAALVFLCLASGRAWAQQQNSGTVSGNVVDSQGAVISNAKVSLIDTSEGKEIKTQSNAKGEYLFAVVPIGNYQLKVTAPTFQTYIVNDLQVNAAANVRLDAHMSAGAVEAQVTVQAEGTTLDTRSATLGTMIDPQMVEGLPVDGENIVSLAALLPGVTDVNAPTTFTSDTGGPTYSVSGSRGNQNLFLFDGLIWNNVFYNTGLNYPPRLALEEVSVLLNNYKAQYGRNSGSVFNVLSRRGANAIHGAVWEYLQNAAFDASDYATGVNPHLVSNQFGATLGGPIKRHLAQRLQRRSVTRLCQPQQRLKRRNPPARRALLVIPQCRAMVRHYFPAAPLTTCTFRPIGLYLHMPKLAGHSAVAAQQLSVRKDSRPDPLVHDDRHQVMQTVAVAKPHLAQGARVGIVVHLHAQPCPLFNLRLDAQRRPAQVRRKHQPLVPGVRAPRQTDPNAVERLLLVRRDHVLDRGDQRLHRFGWIFRKHH